MPTANQRISEYVLEQKIGVGTFGEVWKARHHVWADQYVAIKIPTLPEYIRNLQHEGAAIHGLVHPNIVRAIGFDPFYDPPYLIMEYIPGTSLRTLIKNRRLTIQNVIDILNGVLAGLATAHSKGIVHRDIKPENILIHERARVIGVTGEGMVKVTDFGLGKAAATGSILYSQSIGGSDGSNVAGTLDYMAPEQRAGGEVDGRADLYACGVMLFEMLTGERPAGLDLPSRFNSATPPALDEVFRRCYARLRDRYASAAEAIAALNEIRSAPAKSPAANLLSHEFVNDAERGGDSRGAQQGRQTEPVAARPIMGARGATRCHAC